jgi:putative membrane protein
MLDFDRYAFFHGATAFLIAFAAAGVFTIAFKLIYQWVTPYHEQTLIRQGNTAAAISLGGALIGYVLPLASALSHTVSLREFAAWALLAAVIQILAFVIVSRVAFRKLAERIEAGEIAGAVYLASISICIGLLNAACMTA